MCCFGDFFLNATQYDRKISSLVSDDAAIEQHGRTQQRRGIHGDGHESRSPDSACSLGFDSRTCSPDHVLEGEVFTHRPLKMQENAQKVKERRIESALLEMQNVKIKGFSTPVWYSGATLHDASMHWFQDKILNLPEIKAFFFFFSFQLLTVMCYT